MDLSELEKKVARLVPRRLRRDADGTVTEAKEAEVSQAPGEALPQRLPPRRAPRVPQAETVVPDTPVAEVELLPTELERGARDARDCMLQHGASTALADRVVRAILASGARGAFAIDAAAEELGRSFALEAPPRLADAPHVLVFVGPTGAGKTATLAKLGRKLQGAGRDVLFATLDPFSVSGFGNASGHGNIGGYGHARSLGMDLDRTELPLEVVRDADGLRDLYVKRGGADIVMVDTPGLSPRDGVALGEFAETLAKIARLGSAHVYLVLPASASRAALALATAAFAGMGPTAAVITKLDETTEPGGALEEAQRAGLPLSFLCDGQDVRSHLVRANGNKIADLFLRGKLA